MVNQRVWISPNRVRSHANLRCRLYSSTLNKPASTTAHAKCISQNPQDIRYPCMEDILGGGHFQPHTHDIFVRIPLQRKRTALFRVFFKRHVSLQLNRQLGIRGDLVVMRVASKNKHSVVNMRCSDDQLVDAALRRHPTIEEIPRAEEKESA
ncbi:hypothetical protein CPC08DRAFT_726520 [Agrocybe pediades]|nr:hypothetical protein CPC08DRAFT_726520 [Agrocybe pediades]